MSKRWKERHREDRDRDRDRDREAGSDADRDIHTKSLSNKTYQSLRAYSPDALSVVESLWGPRRFVRLDHPVMNSDTIIESVPPDIYDLAVGHLQ